MFKQENAKTFLYFQFSDRFFNFFFSIFENLSSAGLKNRKLDCSGLIKILLQCTTVATQNFSLQKNSPAKLGDLSHFHTEWTLLHHMHTLHYLFSIN